MGHLLDVAAGLKPAPTQSGALIRIGAPRMGSMPAARRAGTQQARSATATSRQETLTNVSGSVGLTSKTRAITRVRASAATTPMPTPASASRIPCRSTSRSTCCFGAPKATRIPSSFVRLATDSETTPYSPMATRTRPRMAKPPKPHVVSLVPTDVEMTLSIDEAGPRAGWDRLPLPPPELRLLARAGSLARTIRVICRETIGSCFCGK